MKNKLLVVSVLLLLCISPAARAGFIVKTTSLASGYTTTGSVAINTTVSRHGKTGFLEKLNKHLGFLHPYQFHKQSEWVGIAAIGCGILGLLVPGVNFLAILFGVLGMGRGCKQQGLAVAGFIMGMIELILFLFLQTVFISLILL